MWPWEHAAVAYLAYSLWCHGARRRPPTDAGAVAVLLGSQFPDLVDKPLAWWVGVLPAGRSLAHSLLVALPLVVAVAAWTRWAGYRRVGGAFAVGYLSHLPADVFYPVLLGSDGPAVSFLLYPLVPVGPGSQLDGFAKLQHLLAEFSTFLGTPRGTVYLLGELGLLAAALAVWSGDGRPGLGVVRRRVRRALA
ncbi:MAG: metal-dependent hydrolase [Haloarculaceae archaeon]